MIHQRGLQQIGKHMKKYPISADKRKIGNSMEWLNESICDRHMSLDYLKTGCLFSKTKMDSMCTEIKWEKM